MSFKRPLLTAFFVIATAMVIAGCISGTQPGNSTITGSAGAAIQPVNTTPSAAPLKVDLFVMSQCPYGVQAEMQLIPVLREFGSAVDFNLYFIAQEQDNGFVSLHGQAEVDEGLRQICVANKEPAKLLDYLECMGPIANNAESAWGACADQVGIDRTVISSCFDSEANALMSENVVRYAQLGVEGSPTVYINDTLYEGGRDTRSFRKGICEYLPNNAACLNMTPEPQVNMIIINDENCSDCDSSWLVNSFESEIFSNLTVKEYDYRSAKGAEFVQNFSITEIPYVLFDESIEAHEMYSELTRYMEELEFGYKHLRIGAVELLNVAESPDTVDLFIMSQCPYGTLAQTALKEVATALPWLNWNVHFIASESDGSFVSLHGQAEVDEDLRQICILREHKEKYLAYTACIIPLISDPAANWQTCAQGAGIDTAQVQSCVSSGRAAQLLSEDITIGNGLGISASPTWMVNSRYFIGGGAADAVKASVCAYNPGKEGCSTQLTTTTAAPSGSCGS